MDVAVHPKPSTAELAALREQVACAQMPQGPLLRFGLPQIDAKLASGGLDGAGLHEIAAASTALGDDAAATLFIAGIAARFVSQLEAGSSPNVLWAMTRMDLYAPGLEQAGLGPEAIVYAQGVKDSEVLAMAEDGLRDGSLACVVAEVKAADRTATRRLQLAAADGVTPLLLYRRHRSSARCPLDVPSSAMTRWRIGCLPSAPLPVPGIGRARWLIELVRQRGGNPFSLEVEACDDTGRLALPSAAPDRTAKPKRTPAKVRASNQAA